MVRDLLNRIIAGESLQRREAEDLMERMMDEELTSIQLGAFLVALRAKGETADEVAGFARTMRKRARRIDTRVEVLDTCGTGGDGSGTFNISTAAAIIAAACGQPVAKHGNRAASGRCGSADVLEALGIEIALPPEAVSMCIREAGIGFLFAPAFHPAMKFAAVPRRELGVRTVFNLLGPLTNPARPSFQLVGVSHRTLLDLLAEALLGLEIESALVVHSRDETDEISLAGPTEIREVRDGRITSYEVSPDDFVIRHADRNAVRGGDSETNAAILLSIFNGEPGARRDAAVVNAAAALYAARRVDTFKDGAVMAAAAIDSGRAKSTLDQLRDLSRGARERLKDAA